MSWIGGGMGLLMIIKLSEEVKYFLRLSLDFSHRLAYNCKA